MLFINVVCQCYVNQCYVNVIWSENVSGDISHIDKHILDIPQNHPIYPNTSFTLSSNLANDLR